MKGTLKHASRASAGMLSAALLVRLGMPALAALVSLPSSRVDEACAADVADLGTDAGHRVLRVMRKGARRAKVPLTPATVAALDAYLAGRARRADHDDVLARTA